MGSRGVSERLGRKVGDLPSRGIGDELELRRKGMGRFGMLSYQFCHESREDVRRPGKAIDLSSLRNRRSSSSPTMCRPFTPPISHLSPPSRSSSRITSSKTFADFQGSSVAFANGRLLLYPVAKMIKSIFSRTVLDSSFRWIDPFGR
jgi:hypothetical protein